MYYAAKGHGARLNGRPILVHAYDPKDLLFTVYLGSNAHPDAARVARLARRVRNLGAASLDLCLVARGAADLYYMHSAVADTKLRAVDIAAGTLIVREAGGIVLDLGGRDLDLPLESKARTDLVAVGTGGGGRRSNEDWHHSESAHPERAGLREARRVAARAGPRGRPRVGSGKGLRPQRHAARPHESGRGPRDRRGRRDPPRPPPLPLAGARDQTAAARGPLPSVRAGGARTP